MLAGNTFGAMGSPVSEPTADVIRGTNVKAVSTVGKRHRQPVKTTANSRQ
jgi:hypothetical protein